MEKNEPSIRIPQNGDRKRKNTSPARPQRAATKSRYFESKAKVESEVEGDPEASSVVEEESESEDISDEEEQTTRKKKTASSSGTKSQSIPASGVRGKELWRQGVNTGLAPGTQIVIKKPKPRATGKTPYSDDTIHPNTMSFLKDLKANNDREWLRSEFLPFSMHIHKTIYHNKHILTAYSS
jgi:hypothetical protein